MIVVTGAKGFIASNFIAMLEQEPTDHPVVAVDWISPLTIEPNLAKRKNIWKAVQPEQLSHFLDANKRGIEAVVHLGAISSTTVNDKPLLFMWNTNYTVHLFNQCALLGIPFLYASSASIYGNGNGPLSPYAESKLSADNIISVSALKPPRWSGLRFFNVYGPNEWHKGKQASMVTQLYGKEEAWLFEGKPTRDFIHVKDCCRVMMEFFKGNGIDGIIDVGTGTSRRFDDIASILNIPINHVPISDELAKQYQWKTQADMSWAGPNFHAMTLEEGIADYVNNHLSQDDPYL